MQQTSGLAGKNVAPPHLRSAALPVQIFQIAKTHADFGEAIREPNCRCDRKRSDDGHESAHLPLSLGHLDI